MYCSRCGNEIKKGEKFCINCGGPVEGIKEVKSVSAPIQFNYNKIILLVVAIIAIVGIIGVVIYRASLERKLLGKWQYIAEEDYEDYYEASYAEFSNDGWATIEGEMRPYTVEKDRIVFSDLEYIGSATEFKFKIRGDILKLQYVNEEGKVEEDNIAELRRVKE